jgi:SM-20-related protein
MRLLLKHPGTREIKVKVMLAGGHTAMIAVPPEHPLLVQLLEAVAQTGSPAPGSGPFQIPVDGGRASLTFARSQLVGIVTDPAVILDMDSTATPVAPQAPAPDTTAGPTPEPPHATVPAPRIVRHPLVQLDGFLGPVEGSSLRDRVIAAQPEFRASWINDEADKDYRQSLVMNAPDDIVRIVVDRIRVAMPEVMAKLGMPPFPVGQIECQVTASNDGSYFRVHTDRGQHAIDATRQLTYVYYFNREPKGFSGGELRVYDDQVRNGKLARIESYQLVEPRNDSIVFFDAAVMHEVMPVHVRSRDFRDSRFTVNGWVHRV